MKIISRSFTAVVISFLLIFCLNGCSGKENNENKESAQVPDTGSAKSKSSSVNSISGKVIETFNSGGYTYVNVENSGETLWVAVPEMEVKSGDVVNLFPGTVMENFKSNTLNRNFDKIIFSVGPADKGNVLAPGNAGNSEVKPAGPIKVEKAKGKNAYTVAEIYEKRKELDNKNIVVRGKVVKVLRGIMGKNWIHLQDGTGDSLKGTNDLVITSKNVPESGNVVTAEGKAASDKDFGSGYEYIVIIEDAELNKN